MPDFRLRAATSADRFEVAELICVSTNYWYQKRASPPMFRSGPEPVDVFWQVYEALDPGCCVVAENSHTGRLMGSCFYHPREHHVSLGIMNVHPNYFGRGVARELLNFITGFADRHGFPAVRLVQSASNLDSFSLYTRAGFVPRQAYQDMLVQVPPAGLGVEIPAAAQIRPATPHDVAAMIELELEVSGICREKDYRHFIANEAGVWQSLVYEGPGRRLEGFMFSLKHPGLSMIGPGVTRHWQQAASLLLTALDRYRGGAGFFLVPVECHEMVQQLYALGARNCEIHFAQVRGQFQPLRGISMPVFLPESA
jgi:GNAT superfamily N-acetyltransferase